MAKKLRIVFVFLAVMLLTTSALAAEDGQARPVRWDSVSPAQAGNSGLMMLVNQEHTIPKDYVPELTRLSDRVPCTTTVDLRPEAAEAYERMYRDMVAQGVKGSKCLSGYRSYATQQYLVNATVEKKMRQGMSRAKAYANTIWGTAPAGASEHQTGLALDITVSGVLDESFADTAVGTWLREHAWEYGFALRYQGNKRSLTKVIDEPWHYRYLGVPHAQILRESCWCYEEYIEYLHANGVLSAVVGEDIYDIYWTQDENRVFQNVVDVSRDNAGGWIITTLRTVKPQSERPIPLADFADLCGLPDTGVAGETVTREAAAKMLVASGALPDQTLTYLCWKDVADIDGAYFQALQQAVSNGLFVGNTPDNCFRPKDLLTLAEGSLLATRFRAVTSQT